MQKRLITTLALAMTVALVSAPTALAAASDLNQVIDNLAITPTGAAAIDVFNGGSATAQVIVDCSGYFSLG